MSNKDGMEKCLSDGMLYLCMTGCNSYTVLHTFTTQENSRYKINTVISCQERV